MGLKAFCLISSLGATGLQIEMNNTKKKYLRLKTHRSNAPRRSFKIYKNQSMIIINRT